MSDTEQPLSEAAVRAMLAKAEAAKLVCNNCCGTGAEPFTDGGDRCLACHGKGEVPQPSDAPALARECLRLRALLGEAADEGHIWSAIRGALPGLRAVLHSAAYAEGYERESAYFDAIAAALAAAVAARVRAHLHPTETPE